jgi:uncharacterized protein (DUF2062 family)
MSAAVGLERRVLDPIVALLSRGASADALALSLAVGVTVGVFPVLGSTTVLCTLAALAMRLNLVAVQAAHFAMTPVQIVLIIPFVRLGERSVGTAHQPLSIDAGLELIAQGAIAAIVTLRDAILHAMLGWLLVGPVAIALLYVVLRPLLRRTAQRVARDPSP